MECVIEKEREGRAKEDPVEQGWWRLKCNYKNVLVAWNEVHSRVQCKNCAHLTNYSMFFDSEKDSASADTNDEIK